MMERDSSHIYTVALAGNPNVGKSTLFNALTGLRQHTGNWTGKTVGCAWGECRISSFPMRIVDLPGTYSLTAHSEEERVAKEYLESQEADVIAVVCDGGCLERNLILVLQILSLTRRVVLCVNLLDEAEKRGISVDLDVLRRHLKIPVTGMSARSGVGVREAVEILEAPHFSEEAYVLPQGCRSLADCAKEIADEAVSRTKEPRTTERCLDRLLTGKYTAFPLMFLFLCGIFWLTVTGANKPSEWLSHVLFGLEKVWLRLMTAAGAPSWLSGALVFGVWRTVAWVVSVMLPPMAIFFPLFTVLEDFGVLPRVAYNFDRCFQKCDACGKQALTM